MSVRTGTNAFGALVGAGVLIAAVALWGPGNEEDGGIEVARDKPCYVTVTFSANWGDKDVIAEQIEWGQVSNTGSIFDVAAPWTVTERIACWSTALISVKFPDGVNPGRALCALTARGVVYEPLTPPEDRWPRCTVREFIQ